MGLAEAGAGIACSILAPAGTRRHRRGDHRRMSTLSEANRRGFRRGGGRLRLDERRRGADGAVSLAVSGAGMANARRACTDANTYGAKALLTAAEIRDFASQPS
jgi:hypothetical protein